MNVLYVIIKLRKIEYDSALSVWIITDRHCAEAAKIFYPQKSKIANCENIRMVIIGGKCLKLQQVKTVIGKYRTLTI